MDLGNFGLGKIFGWKCRGQRTLVCETDHSLKALGGGLGGGWVGFGGPALRNFQANQNPWGSAQISPEP